MTQKQFRILILAAALVIAAAAIALYLENGSTGGQAESGLLAPGFAARVNDVTEIAIETGEGSLTFRRNADNSWGLAEKSGYPALYAKVKELIVGVAEAGKIEAKTANPEYYGRIGLADPGAAEGAGKGITFKAGEETLFAGVFGERKLRPGGIQAWTYVRAAGEAQSWLADKITDIPDSPMRWLADDLVKLNRDRVKTVTVTQAGGAVLTVTRAAPGDHDFVVAGLPEGAELTSASAPNSVGGALSYLSFDDVRPQAEIDFSSATEAVFAAFDGLVVSVRTAKVGDHYWSAFAARYDAENEKRPAEDETEIIPDVPEDGQAEADSINARVMGWAYELPGYKAEDLVKRLEDLLKSKDEDGDEDGDGAG